LRKDWEKNNLFENSVYLSYNNIRDILLELIKGEIFVYISELVNEYGRKYSPYMDSLVNHLPMTQLALFRLYEDYDKVRDFTEAIVDKVKIEPVKSEYLSVNSIEDTLGKPELYESCVRLIKREIEEKGVDAVVRNILNTYYLGISSDLFHPIIRLAYAVESYKLDEGLEEEVARALAYYVTAYREGKVFKREIHGYNILDEMEALVKDPYINMIRSSLATTGHKLNALYNYDEFQNKGFVIGGFEENKVRLLLNLILPAFVNSNDSVILHCISGLHSVVALREYFDDFNNILDIATSFIITHLLTVDRLDFANGSNTLLDFSWPHIICLSKDTTDIHTIKLTYSCSELGKVYDTVGLKKAVKRRLFG